MLAMHSETPSYVPLNEICMEGVVLNDSAGLAMALSYLTIP